MPRRVATVVRLLLHSSLLCGPHSSEGLSQHTVVLYLCMVAAAVTLTRAGDAQTLAHRDTFPPGNFAYGAADALSACLPKTDISSGSPMVLTCQRFLLPGSAADVSLTDRHFRLGRRRRRINAASLLPVSNDIVNGFKRSLDGGFSNGHYLLSISTIWLATRLLP